MGVAQLFEPHANAETPLYVFSMLHFTPWRNLEVIAKVRSHKGTSLLFGSRARINLRYGGNKFLTLVVAHDSDEMSRFLINNNIFLYM